ncbi:hypothetical protein J1N35_026381 [Gossypium stocksii]|uniref:Uncharacterized protein n=1 Tax=Gossypium stocksii TaxID=47602 RepID=A0A9D3VAJ8_9ROSI|nr:hypothetical protein J1N35_026381 [Gossypium stocksii]
MQVEEDTKKDVQTDKEVSKTGAFDPEVEITRERPTSSGQVQARKMHTHSFVADEFANQAASKKFGGVGRGVKVSQSKTIIDSVSDEDIQKILAEATQAAKKQEERMMEMKNKGLWMLLAPRVGYVKPYVHNLLRSVSDMHSKLHQKVFVWKVNDQSLSCTLSLNTLQKSPPFCPHKTKLVIIFKVGQGQLSHVSEFQSCVEYRCISHSHATGNGSLYEWIELNLRNNHEVNRVDGVNWACLFRIIIWRMWKNRNLRTFQGLSWSTDVVIKASLCWAKQHVSVSGSQGIRTSRSDFAPLSLDGWVYLNTNGSVRNVDRYVVARRLLRDHDGTWIVGFRRYSGNCEVMDLELWGILDGCS